MKLKFFSETLGLSPLPVRLQQAKIALLGEEDVPRSKFGLSSLKHLHPKVAIPLWMGKKLVPGKVILSNLFNHTQTPIEEGWSVKKTQVKDFRGKDLTYNSHNGTDLSVPVGSTLLASAPGEVVCIKSEFHRGGLKIFIDHGHGIMTCSVHLARALVKVGDTVKRAQPIAITGYSGLDGAVTFPFGIPHVHFNTWHNGEPVDPFAYGGQASLWKSGNLPLPFDQASASENFAPSVYVESKVAEAIASCKTASVRERLSSIKDLKHRAAETIIEMNYYPTRFTKRVNVYDKSYPRKPLLDLPFSKEEFDGVVFMDEM